MDPFISIPCLLLIFGLLGAYWIRCHRARIPTSQSKMLNLGTNAISIYCASILIAGGIYQPALKYVSELNLYLVLFGLMMLTNAISTAKKILEVKSSSADQNYIATRQAPTKRRNSSA